MKKIILILSLFTTIAKGQTITDSQFSYIADYPDNTKSVFNWFYQINYGDYTTKYLGGLDSGNVWFNALNRFQYSVNTNTVLIGADNNGNLSRFSISDLPFKSSSYTPTLSLLGYTLSAGGNSITLPSTDLSNYYTKSQSDSRYLQSFTEVDGSISNELQTLSINSNSISLSNGGGTVALPSQTTQTLTGSNGITITSAANTFTISKTKRQETYSGTTNSGGTYTVSFGTSYSVAPNIQANIIGGTANQVIVITSISTTGFTINVYQRNAVTLLSTEVLLASTVNVNGANIDVLITEK